MKISLESETEIQKGKVNKEIGKKNLMGINLID